MMQTTSHGGADTALEKSFKILTLVGAEPPERHHSFNGFYKARKSGIFMYGWYGVIAAVQ
jgi:hypothetical protein